VGRPKKMGHCTGRRGKEIAVGARVTLYEKKAEHEERRGEKVIAAAKKEKKNL